MNYLNTIKTIIILGIVTVFFSCAGDGSGSNTGNGKQEEQTGNGFNKQDSGTETYYLIPSPEELFRFIHDGKLKFSKSIVNPSDKLNSYISTRSKELNFGIYSADLAYVASFSNYQLSVDYLGVVRTLSDEISISSVFDKNLINRISNMSDKPDSLLKITNDTYVDIVSYLEAAERQKTLAQIVTGGWVESIYVVCNLIDSYEKNTKIISLLASQKVIIANLMMYLKQQKDDDNVKLTIKDLEPIAKFYESLKTKTLKEGTPKKKNDNRIIVGGNVEVILTKQEFEVLKNEITKLRNKITNN